MIQQIAETILSGQTTSLGFHLQGDLFLGFINPAAIDGTLSIEVYDFVNDAWVAYVDSAVTFTASTYQQLDPANTGGIGKLRFKLSTSATADRKFVIVKQER